MRLIECIHIAVKYIKVDQIGNDLQTMALNGLVTQSEVFDLQD